MIIQYTPRCDVRSNSEEKNTFIQYTMGGGYIRFPDKGGFLLAHKVSTYEMPIRSYKMSICTQLFKHTMTGPTWTFPSFMFRAIAYPFAPLRHIVYKPTHQASACLLGDKTTHTKAAFLIKSFVLYHIKRHCR